MNLKKRIAKDFKDVQKTANSLFAYSSNEIFKKIDIYNRDTLRAVALMLTTIHPPITYRSLIAHRALEHLRAQLYFHYDTLAEEITSDWTHTRNQFDLLGRLSLHFISTKASPPWKKSVLDLKTELTTDGRYDPRTGRLKFYFRNMVDSILRQIQSGALKEESPNQIMARIKKMFDNKRKQGVRERFKKIDTGSPVQMAAQSDDESPVDISEGVYTEDDVTQLKADLTAANDWEYRQINPQMSDALRANNAYLRSLEQILQADAIDQLHSGMLQIGGDNLGIDDMEWVATHTSTTCDYCTDRDGLTTSEISDQIKDEYGDDPPPLHPNCFCQLIPKIKDDWADNALSDAGQDWDPETGSVIDDEGEVDDSQSKMTFDEYLKMVG